MPAWGNTDNRINKPKSPNTREVREVIQMTVFTGNTTGNNVIQVSYLDGGANNVANIGITAGQYVYFYANGFNLPGGTNGNGVPSMFASNTTVSSTSGNTITLSTALFNTVSAGFGVEFDKAIAYSTNKPVEKTYNSDTILITATRSANNSNAAGAIANVGNLNAGWNHIVKKTNSDGTVRYLKETLVALANPTASNTSSGNTSFGQVVTGL